MWQHRGQSLQSMTDLCISLFSPNHGSSSMKCSERNMQRNERNRKNGSFPFALQRVRRSGSNSRTRTRYSASATTRTGRWRRARTTAPAWRPASRSTSTSTRTRAGCTSTHATCSTRTPTRRTTHTSTASTGLAPPIRPYPVCYRFFRVLSVYGQPLPPFSSISPLFPRFRPLRSRPRPFSSVPLQVGLLFSLSALRSRPTLRLGVWGALKLLQQVRAEPGRQTQVCFGAFKHKFAHFWLLNDEYFPAFIVR